MGCTLKDNIKLDPTKPMNDDPDEKIKLSPSKLGVNPTDERIPLSRGFVIGPDETQQTKLNYTGVLGSCENIWTGCLFGWGKPSHYRIFKESESFDAVHGRQDNPFYQSTIGEKQKIEQEINTILPNLEREHTEIELIKHDLRRAEELKTMFDDGDEAGLKMMFVDQVDFFSGGGGQGQPGRLSMATMRNNNIMPTIVEDFISMEDSEDINEGGKLFGLAQVEKNMLKVKWDGFQRWKDIFGKGVDSRYRMADNLLKSKKHMLEERKKWLLPRVSRLKRLTDILEVKPGAMSHHWIERKGELTSIHSTSLVLYKEYNIAQVNFPLQDLGQYAKTAPMYDWFIQENHIFDAKKGLIAKYPWITEDWVEGQIDALKSASDPEPATGGGALFTAKVHFPIKEDCMYYFLYTVGFDKTILNVRTPEGKETPLEDGEWDIKNYVITKNFLLLILLDQNAKQEAFVKDLDKFVFKHDDFFNIQYFMDVYGNMTILPKEFKIKKERKERALKSLESEKTKLEKSLKTNQKDKTLSDKLSETNLMIELIGNGLVQKETRYNTIFGKGAKYFEYKKNGAGDKRKSIFSKHRERIKTILKNYAGQHYDDNDKIIFQRVSGKNVKNPAIKENSLLSFSNSILRPFGLTLASDNPFKDPVLDHMTWPGGPYIGRLRDTIIQHMFVQRAQVGGRTVRGAIESKFGIPK